MIRMKLIIIIMIMIILIMIIIMVMITMIITMILIIILLLLLLLIIIIIIICGMNILCMICDGQRFVPAESGWTVEPLNQETHIHTNYSMCICMYVCVYIYIYICKLQDLTVEPTTDKYHSNKWNRGSKKHIYYKGISPLLFSSYEGLARSEAVPFSSEASYTILCYTILYYTVLHCTILYYAMLCYTVRYDTIL